MTGVVITARLLAGEPREAIRRVMALGARPEQLLRPIGTGLVREVQTRFLSATDPTGKAWAPLNPEYAKTKRGPGILRGSGARGGLMGSITRDVQGEELAVGTARIYGAIHQFGGVIRPKKAKALAFRMGGRLVLAKQVTIPARPYLGWGAAEEEVVLEVTEALMMRAIAGGARRGGVVE